MGVLTGRCALITGASKGLGLAIATAYAQAGASVMLCARDETRLASALAVVSAQAGTQRVRAMRADVTVPGDVDALVSETLHQLGGLHVLVNNAGVCGPMGPLETVEWADFTRTLDINLSGSVLPMRAVLPHMKRQRAGKIVQLSGGGATTPMPRMAAYAASKAAIVRLAESVALDVQAFGIDVNSLAPGALHTQMLQQVLDAGAAAVGEAYYARMAALVDGGTTPLEVGAALAVFLGSSESDGITGRLISAPWDAWQHLPDHRERLTGSDVYTLRRILPADRGLDFSADALTVAGQL